ncbi:MULTISPECIES: thiopeptide-type bacteriocin biosynthesis protein [Chryseobacterium]|uniref:Thiopeptide-type bacteriocin biosynthesis domain-containing protein n=1 Tax=Candidatus Chryseobacterium massiliense TaxID=204089 RepID=A0A3D9BDS9_9FLAO|nr:MULTISPECIES: thiopeptide-type bacteriocin biosynthesis protein [Chryseobacterium]REC51683.1 hypothetical protein DRF68_05200 [Candidatus Chryseobacterium massiliae]
MAKEMQRNFLIGDEWIYYKFFCGHNASNKIITEILQPITKELLADKIISQWFFIRYNDPSYHVRFRIKLTNPNYVGHVILRLNAYLKTFVSEELIWNVEIDTYKREIERYGSKTMLISENIFFYDSKIISDFIEFDGNTDKMHYKNLFGLNLMNFYLDSFGLSLERKISFTESLKNLFYKEFGNEKYIKKQIDQVFSNNNILTTNLLLNKITKRNPLTKYIFSYKKEMQLNINMIKKLDNKNELDVNINNLISSYIHMSINRLFKANNRLHELTMYDCLWRYYKKLYFMSKIS